MSAGDSKLPAASSTSDIEAFLRKVESTPQKKQTVDESGRLLFAMDATASREPTWDQACHIQSEMFSATSGLGGLAVKLCFYRGFRELLTTDWCSDTATLARQMAKVRCAGGATQIARLLRYAVKESGQRQVNALVFVGDCMEENIDIVCDAAGQLGLLGVPVFVFQEGHDQLAERAFREIARLSRGAYCRFDSASADQLRRLLAAVAVYAAGGQAALEQFGKRQDRLVSSLRAQIGKTD